MSLLQMSFYGAVLIIVIAAIRAVMINKLPKKTFLILWGIVLFRLLIPYAVQSAFSVYSLISVTAPANVNTIHSRNTDTKTSKNAILPPIITILLSVILIVGVTTAFATSALTQNAEGTVNTDALKAREGAVVDAAVVGLLKEGQKVTILSEEKGFYHIVIPEADGLDAWVRKEYVDVD